MNALPPKPPIRQALEPALLEATPWPDCLRALLPLRGLVVTLRFGAAASFNLYHQAAVSALVRELLNMSARESATLHLFLCTDAVESGRIRYRKGETYRFTVLGLPGSEDLLSRLVASLKRLQVDPKSSEDQTPFRGKVVLESLEDYFGMQPVQPGQPLREYGWNDLLSEAEDWRTRGPMCIRFLSPVALKLSDKAQICSDASQFSWRLLAGRIHSILKGLIKDHPLSKARYGIPPDMNGEVPYKDLFWIGTRYFGRTDAASQSPLEEAQSHTVAPRPDPEWKRLEGLMGVVNLPESAAAILPQLVLCQYLGFGLSRTFGWGRFRLESTGGYMNLRRPRPCHSLLEHLMEPASLLRALSDSRKPDVPARFVELCLRVKRQAYQVPPLSCRTIPKPDGSLRELAIPPFADRQLQRAVARILTHNLDTLFSEGSFGYRPQRSRMQARERLVLAREKGLRWSFETDILQCFDHVNWGQLEVRLRAIFGSDPFVDLLMEWVRAPLCMGGRVQPRTQGLPTGSPLSPVLINLFLDDLDKDLQNQGFHATRYADDLVVQCENETQALAASSAVTRSLDEKGLQIQPGKTRILPPEASLKFLGYEIPGVGLEDRDETLDPEDVFVVQSEPDNPTEGPAYPAMETFESEVVPHPGEDWKGTHLIIHPPVRQVALEHGSLVIRDREGTILQRSPLDAAASVLLLGNHHITPSALRACLARGVPVHFASALGKYQGCAAAGPSAPDLWLRQDTRLADPEACLRFARRTVHARITHQREVLRRHAHKHPEAMARGLEAMKRCQEASLRANSPELLRGLEGLAAKHYFQLFGLLVGPSWGFTTRQQHPAPDPVNALLDLSSSILHHLVDTSLRAEGLNPWCGYMHQRYGRHRVLASDLMEPFRHVMERLVLGALGVILEPKDFDHAEKGVCRLDDAALRRFSRYLHIQLARPFRTPENPVPQLLMGHVMGQTAAFRRWVQEKEADFLPWRNR